MLLHDPISFRFCKRKGYVAPTVQIPAQALLAVLS